MRYPFSGRQEAELIPNEVLNPYRSGEPEPNIPAMLTNRHLEIEKGATGTLSFHKLIEFIESLIRAAKSKGVALRFFNSFKNFAAQHVEDLRLSALQIRGC